MDPIPTATKPDAPSIAISAYIICKDAGATLHECLTSLRRFNEIIVVDSGSSDATLDIVHELAERGLPIRLFEETWRGFAGQKQFALDQCRNDWCLNLDADEVLSPALAAALPALIRQSDVDGWILCRRDHLSGHGLSHQWAAPDDVLRLIRRDKTRYDLDRLIHESPRVDGTVKMARDGDILHYADTNFLPHLERGLRNARLKADMRFAAGKRPSLTRLICSPPGRFIRIYLLRRFFLNGIAGFRYAMIGAIYALASEILMFEKQWHGNASAECVPNQKCGEN